ncbi:hypothetical protein UCREL1_2392 [Eutypa lata UCREL1]|uniref:ditrans,polycis-polyprenyl diphosphate synthase [(2E,6E)-farnesyldiphosphate specific] n=1 Tax=Eutypa lata (strain UCR-EL1) TaxID=1287681 RepID=M7SVF7_EUTLA|nr:hypothetical protein UCREL1_2392 [Eutypa lata UCREL1]
MIQTYVKPNERLNRGQAKSHFGVRKFLRAQLYAFLYVFVHAIFSVYIRFRIAYRAVYDRVLSILNYHHNTPDYVRRDVSNLPRLPKHVSVILTLEDGGRAGDALEKLVSEVAEIAAWCASAGIHQYSVYEKTGVLKRYMPQTHRVISHKLKGWFGTHHAPAVALHARGAEPVQPSSRQADLNVLLISAEDGREAMVDLTKVFAHMAQRDKISTADITIDLIDNELNEAVMPEPDLLLSFEPFVDLQGYPPWPIRLTEIFASPDNQGVNYQVFLRGLRKYSEATFKLGK